MANSRIPGPLNPPLWAGALSARTPGPLGYMDQGDPGAASLLGDTPGPLGVFDLGAPPRDKEFAQQCLAATAWNMRLPKPWGVSASLLTFLGIWENGVANGMNFAKQTVTDGFILMVYNDSKNLPTVGCGHLVTHADKLKLGETITKERAETLLRNDLSVAEKAVNQNVSVALYQCEYDALVSIAFNAGANGVKKLLEFVNLGRYEVVPGRIEKYRTGGGNEGRRKSEGKLFGTGEYDAKH